MGELTELFGRANTEGIHMAIPDLRTKYNSEFNASERFKELHQIKLADTHWTFTSPAAMIGIALAVFLIRMLIWKRCIHKDEIPTPMPPMPAQDLNPRPIINLMTCNQATKSNESIPININIS